MSINNKLCCTIKVPTLNLTVNSFAFLSYLYNKIYFKYLIFQMNILNQIMLFFHITTDFSKDCS